MPEKPIVDMLAALTQHMEEKKIYDEAYIRDTAAKLQKHPDLTEEFYHWVFDGIQPSITVDGVGVRYLVSHYPLTRSQAYRLLLLMRKDKNAAVAKIGTMKHKSNV